MTRKQKIKKLTSAGSCTPVVSDNSIFETNDKTVSRWAIKAGMHVQGMTGCKGQYLAYIWVDEPVTEASYIK